MGEIKKIVRYYVQKRSSWPDQSPQRLRNVELAFNYDGGRLCALTGMKVALCDWDEKRQRVKVSVKRSAEVNRYLDPGGIELKFCDIFKMHLIEYDPLFQEIFQKLFANCLQIENKKGLHFHVSL